MINDESHYAALAASYARGALGHPDLGDDAALEAAAVAGLRLHRFKRTAGLPRVQRVLGILRGLQVEQLVDVGSGRGAFLWPLLDELPYVHVTAIDVLRHRVVVIERVRRGGLARLRAARMDACAMAFRDDAADVVTLLEVLEHMPAPENAAREAVRVARRAVVASVPAHEDQNPEHIQLFDRRALERMFLASGARRVSLDQVHGHLLCVAMVD